MQTYLVSFFRYRHTSSSLIRGHRKLIWLYLRMYALHRSSAVQFYEWHSKHIVAFVDLATHLVNMALWHVRNPTQTINQYVNENSNPRYPVANSALLRNKQHSRSYMISHLALCNHKYWSALHIKIPLLAYMRGIDVVSSGFISRLTKGISSWQSQDDAQKQK